MRLAPLVRAVKSFGFCAGLGFRARFFVRVPSRRRRPVAGPPRSCPRPARRGRPRASSRSSSCAPATSPLPPIPPHVTPACPASLPPPSLFSASHLCRDPVPAAPLPPPPFRTTSTFATLRSHPLSRGFALLFRLALALHSCPAPAFRPSNPPLPAKNCYGTILIVP